MNKPEMIKLAKYVLNNPEQYNQDVWFKPKNGKITEGKQPLCGTAGCIAGNFAFSKGMVPYIFKIDGDGYIAKVRHKQGRKNYAVNDFARIGLGLTEDQAVNLFSTFFDSGRFMRRYHAAATPKQKAQVGHDWIMHNIKKIEKEEKKEKKRKKRELYT